MEPVHNFIIAILIDFHQVVDLSRILKIGVLSHCRMKLNYLTSILARGSQFNRLDRWDRKFLTRSWNTKLLLPHYFQPGKIILDEISAMTTAERAGFF